MLSKINQTIRIEKIQRKIYHASHIAIIANPYTCKGILLHSSPQYSGPQISKSTYSLLSSSQYSPQLLPTITTEGRLSSQKTGRTYVGENRNRSTRPRDVVSATESVV